MLAVCIMHPMASQSLPNLATLHGGAKVCILAARSVMREVKLVYSGGYSYRTVLIDGSSASLHGAAVRPYGNSKHALGHRK